MELNHWTKQLHSLYDQAVVLYKNGQRDAATFFDAAGTEYLNSIGLKPIHIYDYAEDFNNSGEPDWDTVLLMVAARRDYFIHEMHGKWTAASIKQSDLPPKDATYENIEWLPRIIPKAKAYLEGALPPEIMYCCGGDRKFLKANRLHPADFLRVVWATKADKDQLAKYIKSERS